MWILSRVALTKKLFFIQTEYLGKIYKLAIFLSEEICFTKPSILLSTYFHFRWAINMITHP